MAKTTRGERDRILVVEQCSTSRWQAFPRRRDLAVIAVVAGLAMAAVADADWTQFRGRDGSGTTAPGLLGGAPGVAFSDLWKRPLGSGYTGIVAAGGIGVTMASDGTDDVVLAFDLAAGTDRWRYPLAPTYKGHDGSDDGPIGTPAIVDGTVYALGPRGQLVALALADGTLRWRKELAAPELRPPHYGVTSSPVVVGELLVLATGGEGNRAVTALRRADGSVAWTWGEDTVSYQTVLAASVHGELQVVAGTNHLLAGIDAATGAERWSIRHTPENGDGFGQPVALGQDRFLVQTFDEAIAVAVDRQGGTWAARELWRRNSFQRTYAIPVLHDGVLYGFNGRFLTAVEPATGEVLWKSRPPGGRGLTLLDGHLLVVGDDGVLAVVRADRSGYREVGRAPVLASIGYTVPTPIVADGMVTVLVRNLEQMAALRLTAGALVANVAPAAPRGPAPVAAVVDLLAKVDAAPADKKQRLVEDFYARQASLPLIDASGKVTFLVRADQDAGVAGNWPEPQDEVAMQRVAGTDLFHATLELDPRAHYEYRFSVDFGDRPVPDPGNPIAVNAPQGPGSELRMPGLVVPAYLAPDLPAPAEAGRLVALPVTPPGGGDPRELTVYLPPGYDAAENQARKYPLVVVMHGAWARDFGALPDLFDRLIERGELAPLVSVMVPRQSFPEYASLEGLAATTKLVDEAVLPAVSGRYRVREDAAGRGLVGVGTGAQAALWVALAAPADRFGFVGLQSLYRPAALSEENAKLLAARQGVDTLHAYVEISPLDYVDAGQGVDSPRDAEALAAALRGRGATVGTGEVIGAPAWSRWRLTFDRVLSAFPALRGGAANRG